MTLKGFNLTNFIHPSSLKLISKVSDINDPEFLSLEQQKEKENDEKRLEISTDNKNKVLKMIEELRSEFDEIMKM